MTLSGWGLILTFTALVALMAKPVGAWLFALYEGRATPLHRVLGPIERGFIAHRASIPRANRLACLCAAYAGLSGGAHRLYLCHPAASGVLPLNPRALAGIGADGAMNTAIAFVTNTNWQWYGGESVLSNFSQMVGLTIHNFLSAATGIAVAFALFRGFARHEAATVGNFWADCTRVTLYPAADQRDLCLFLVASGVPRPSPAGGCAHAGRRETGIVLGPVASQEAIKMLGTNGGGFQRQFGPSV
jgi:K+-transporting ATPase ATPase A chain